MRPLRLVGVLCVTMLAAAGMAHAAPVKLDGVLAQQYAQSVAAPGIAARVSAPGLEWSGQLGTSDRATGVPLRQSDTYRIASVTKTFTAAAVLRLVDLRQVRLDAPITAYLPDPYPQLLRSGGYRPEQITVRQLLSHTSGLYDYATDDGFRQTVA
jgi:D-alanyl-D-alanine carboxypeptidase